jgi:AcrR family transcriptional regulator
MIKATAQTIVEAAQRTLQKEGFSGATSRAIGREGGFNQALIFYHYGSLEGLLVAALQQTSEQRLERYRAQLASVTTLSELVPAMAQLWEEDRAAGHVQLVVQMVAGSINRPELAGRVVELMDPWVELATETLTRMLPAEMPIDELAYGVSVWYLGLNLLTHLDPEHSRGNQMFDRANELAPLLDALLPHPTS